MDMDADGRAEVRAWYHGVIRRMKEQGLERHGHLATLPFTQRRMTIGGRNVSASSGPASVPAEQLALLQDERFKQLRERMAILRQRIQGNTAEAEMLAPPTDPSTQSD